MAFFSKRIHEILKHALGMLVVGVVILACAIALTFVVDWMRETRRPEWLIQGAEGMSVMMFVADGIAIVAVCFRVVFETIKDLFGKKHETS